jgi:hypothetical protein
MPVSKRHAEEIAGQRKRQNLTPSVRQQFVKADDALRKAKSVIRQVTLREYRLSRAWIDLGREQISTSGTQLWKALCASHPGVSRREVLDENNPTTVAGAST